MKRRSGGTRGTEDDETSLALGILPSSTYVQIQSSSSTAQPVAVPSSTRTAFTSTKTAFESTGSITTPPLATGVTQNFATSNASAWDNMGHGLKGGVIVAAVIGLVAITFFSAWFCCGGRGSRRRKASSNGNAGVLPLHSVPREDRPQDPSNTEPQVVRGDAPPPRYEEVVPSQHQRLAGGITHGRDDEEAGVVADGKTPLSEIPFEDIVLEHTISESSSSQSFSTRHHNGMGDTRGHTNS